MEEVDVVVVANNGPAAKRTPALLRDDQILIDLAGGARGAQLADNQYEGIAW